MTNDEIVIGQNYFTRVKRGWIEVQAKSRTSVQAGRRHRTAFIVENVKTGREHVRRASSLYLSKPDGTPPSNPRPAMLSAGLLPPPAVVAPDIIPPGVYDARLVEIRIGGVPVPESCLIIDDPVRDVPSTPAQRRAARDFYRLTFTAHLPKTGTVIHGSTGFHPDPTPKTVCGMCGDSGQREESGRRVYCECPAGIRARSNHF